MDQRGRHNVRWWGKLDIGDRHVLLSTDGDLKLIDLFFVTGADLLEELVSDPYAFKQHLQLDQCRYILDIPDLQDGSTSDERLARIRGAITSVCTDAATDPYQDEQFVARYDIDNGPGDDHAYYRALADEIDATKIIDLGCGTGVLTLALASPGRMVIGIDPSATMLAYARRKPGAEAITWVHGDASAVVGAGDADLALSSGNTMMHIRPTDYPMVLERLCIALRREGVFSFETRNPDARAWERWKPPEVHSEGDTSLGYLRERLVWRSAVSATVLYFRTAEDITADLERAGFGDVAVYGGWHNEPATADSRVLVFCAIKR
ncbi:MAG: class I SAM-dependent methyltransferase [Sciscionella sp.]